MMTMINQDFVTILGVRIDRVGLKQAQEKVRAFLRSDKQRKIFTPNPEMLVAARKDEYFRNVLNAGDLNICDGRGIELVSKLSFRAKSLGYARDKLRGVEESLLERIPGVDFMQDICKIAEEENKSVYLLGSGSEEVVKKTREALLIKFHRLKIVGGHQGMKLETRNTKLETKKQSPIPNHQFPVSSFQFPIIFDKQENDSILNNIILTAPDILFVAFGHGKQEKWIHEYLKDLPSVKVAMGVGGAFDYLSGKIKRAPKLVQNIGMEWLWRFFKEPRRFLRILNATVVFSISVLIFNKK
ncbi:MAG: WecB/TagA/CpsF family glycosyltransferase [Patescibacteria group bacterium]